MDISLSKLPWYGQIGAFVVVCGMAVYGFWNFYVIEAEADLALKQTHLTALNTDITYLMLRGVFGPPDMPAEAVAWYQDLLKKVVRHGVVIDVKSVLDADALRHQGIRVWRL